MKKILILLVTLLSAGPLMSQEGFIGEIRMFAGNFAPRGWAFCEGQLLPISQNTALFSILGTTYGGDGRTTFALPDMRGRVSIHPGTGPGLTTKRLGERGGQETVTLNINQIPSHNHSATLTLYADSSVATTDNPQNMFPARNAGSTPQYGDSANTTLAEGVVTVSNSGGSQPHSIMQPFVTVNYIICLQGIFPSRN